MSDLDIAWDSLSAQWQTSPALLAPPAPAPARSVIKCPQHTRQAFNMDTMPAIVRWAAGIVQREQVDAIVACGHSGLPLAGAVSYLTHVPVFAVRKDSEEPVATGMRVSGIAPHGPATRWVWFDDFICSGGTFKRSRQHAHAAGLIASVVPHAILSYGSIQRPECPIIVTTGGSVFRAYDEADANEYRELGADIVPLFGFLPD